MYLLTIVIIRPATRPIIDVVKAGIISPIIYVILIEVEPTCFNTLPSIVSTDGAFCNSCIEAQIATKVNSKPNDVQIPGKLFNSC